MKSIQRIITSKFRSYGVYRDVYRELVWRRFKTVDNMRFMSSSVVSIGEGVCDEPEDGTILASASSHVDNRDIRINNRDLEEKLRWYRQSQVRREVKGRWKGEGGKWVLWRGNETLS
jgi:hypothetical protein